MYMFNFGLLSAAAMRLFQSCIGENANQVWWTSLDELYQRRLGPPERPSSVQYVSTIGTALAEIFKRETGGEVRVWRVQT